MTLIPYTAPEKPFRAELEIQKSLFIADIAPAADMEEAAAFWQTRQKEFRDATHHCFACRVGTGLIQEKSSDDREPQGTAGHPMLHVMQAQDVTCAALVVTRYFGGVKLGTGGLARAYSSAAALALSGAPLLRYTPHLPVTLTLSYDMLGLFERYAGGTDLRIGNRAFTDKVTLSLLAPPDTWKEHEKQLTDLTAGRLSIETGSEVYVPLPVSSRQTLPSMV